MGLATNSFALLCLKETGRTGPHPCPSAAKLGQSRTASLVESITNIIAGIGVAFISQEIIFAWYNIHLSTAANAQIVAWFTAISLVRQFCLRRLFNFFTTHGK